jgi:hypothetical protein
LKIKPWGERCGYIQSQRETFLDVEFTVRVAVENGFCQEGVDGHHGHLSADLDPIVDHAHVFAWPDLAGLVGKTTVVVEAFLSVAKVLGESVLGVVRSRSADFVPVHLADVFQVTSVGQRILRDGEKRVRLRVRLAECGDKSASWIGAAEINCTSRNGVDDPLAER